jgi:hypothetical protein
MSRYLDIARKKARKGPDLRPKRPKSESLIDKANSLRPKSLPEYDQSPAGGPDSEVYAILADPPPWLARVLKRYRTGAVHHTRLGGRDATLRVDLRCLSANVATALGRDPLDGRKLGDEVERAVRLLDESGIETVAADLVVEP